MAKAEPQGTEMTDIFVNIHREIRDPGGAAGDLEQGDEGAVEDAELNRIRVAEERHSDDRICRKGAPADLVNTKY